jgi:hypothetical protein
MASLTSPPRPARPLMGIGTIYPNFSIATKTLNHGSTNASISLDSALLVRTLDVECGLPEQRKK